MSVSVEQLTDVLHEPQFVFLNGRVIAMNEVVDRFGERQYVTPIVEMRNLNKSFPRARALIDAQFELVAGEVHALMGENGAGTLPDNKSNGTPSNQIR